MKKSAGILIYSILRRLAAGAALSCLAAGAFAQTVFTWSGGSSTSNKWSSNANWTASTGGAKAPTSGTSTDIVFAGTKRLSPDMDANYTVRGVTFSSSAGAFTLGSSTSKILRTDVGGITSNSAASQTIAMGLQLNAAQTWTANSGALTVSGNVNLGYNDLNVGGAGNVSLSGILSGGSAGNTLTKQGAGTLTLSGTNTFGHVLRVDQGSVVLTNSAALGELTWGNTVGAAGTLRLQNNITVTEGSFDVAGTIVNNSGANTLAAQVNLQGDSTITSSAGTLTLGGYLDTGSSTLTVNGAGSTVLNQVGGSGGVSVAGSGATTFSQEYWAAGTLTAGGSGAIDFRGNVSAGDIVVANSGATTFSGTADVSYTLAVTGSGATTFADRISAGDLVVSGSGTTRFEQAASTWKSTIGGTGNVSFGGDLSSEIGVTFNNTNTAATVSVAGDINSGGAEVVVGGASRVNLTGSQLNALDLTIRDSVTFTTNSTINLGSGTLTFGGSGTSLLTGPQVNAGMVSVTGSGNQTINSLLSLSSIQLAGSGTTTIGGSGDNYMCAAFVSSGELVLAKSSGAALSGDIRLNGGSILMAGNNQTTNWSDLTLSGGTLYLNNTTQSLCAVSVTANSIIDFGSSKSVFSIDWLAIADGVTLTLLNWSATDEFYIANSPDSRYLSRIVFSSGGEAVWNDFDNRLSARCIPEPRTYGAGMLAAMVLALGIWRRKARRRAG